VRIALRIMPLGVLTRRYLESGTDRLAGVWVDAPLVAGLDAEQLVAQLGLGYTSTAGHAAFDAAPIGAVRFPVTPAVLSRSVVFCAGAVSGGLPGPCAGAVWSGTGFTPGSTLIPEYRLANVAVPEVSELVRLDGSEWTVLKRRMKGAWR